MKFIYHLGTGTYMDTNDDVFVIDSKDMTTDELLTLADGDESVFEEVIDAGRATRFSEI